MALAKKKMARNEAKARMWDEHTHLHPFQGTHFPLAPGTGLQTPTSLMKPNRPSQESARAQLLQSVFCSISYLQKFTLSSDYIVSIIDPPKSSQNTPCSNYEPFLGVGTEDRLPMETPN